MTQSPNRFFIIISLIFGSLYALIIPPFQVPDEFNHFYRSWQITDLFRNNGAGGLTAVRTNDNRVGAELPTSLKTISQPFRTLPFQEANRTSKDLIFNLLKIPLEEDKRSFYDFANTGLYAPTAYPSQVLTILILKPFKINPLYIFYGTRFSTLFLWIFLVSLAIRITSVGKWLMVFMALLPSSLFINSGNNADVISNGLAFLAIAYILKWLNETNKITLKSIGIWTFIVSILSLNKIVYSPLLFLILLVKNENLGGFKRKMSIFMGILTLNVVIMAVWLVHIRPLQITYDEYDTIYRTILPQPLNENVNHIAQLKFILEHPVLYSKILVYSLLKSAPHTLIHYLGKFGWEKNYFPLGINFMLFLVLILRGVSENVFSVETDFHTTKKRYHIVKGAFIMVGVMMVVGVATFLYLNSCSVGGDFVYNLSGKYFIPIFPLFFLILPNVCFVKIKRKLPIIEPFLRLDYQAGFMVFSLLYGVFAVIFRYY
jgi:uncharacterized membrane protein